MVRKIVLAIAAASFIAWAGAAFSEGYQTGYKAGYCYQQFGCIAPIAPIAPIPPIGEDTYMGGYNAGFLAGLAAR